MGQGTRQKTILYLEDGFYMQQRISEKLRDAGFIVIQACNIYEAQEALRGHAIDLLVSDIFKDGLEIDPEFISFIEGFVRDGMPIVFYSGADWYGRPDFPNTKIISKANWGGADVVIGAVNELLVLATDPEITGDKKPTLLCFDDDPDYTSLFSRIASAQGFDVHTCSSMSEACDLLRTHKVDIVLTDIDHDEKNNPTEEFLGFVKSCVHGNISIVFLSGMKYSRLAGIPNSRFIEKDSGCIAQVLEAINTLPKEDNRPYILHLDDEENQRHREIFVGLFTDLRYRIRSVEYASNALESAISDPPDIFITDVNGVCNDQINFDKLMRRCVASNTPIIICSGAWYDDDNVPNIQNSRFCGKPFVCELLAEVSTALAGVSREVLVIDDNPRSRENIVEVLTDAGFAPTTCPTPDHAIDLLKSEPGRFGIVTSDVVFEVRCAGVGIYEICELAISQGAIPIALTAAYYSSPFDEVTIHYKVDGLDKIPDTIHRALKERWLSRKDNSNAPVVDENKLARELEILRNPVSHVETPLVKFRRKVAKDDSPIGDAARGMLLAVDLQDLLRQSFKCEIGCGQICSKRELNDMMDGYLECLARSRKSKSPNPAASGTKPPQKKLN